MRALQPVRCRAHGAADRSDCGVDASLRQPQQGQARLRFQAPLARAPVRLLGRRELAAQPVHLRLLVECRGGGLLADPLGTLAGALRLLDRLLPGAAQLHDLGAMHPADAGEGDHLGLLLAPLRQGGGPLAGAAERVHLLTGLDHAAIHQTRHEGRQLSRGDRDHDLVQQREPLLDLPLSDTNPALLVPGAGDQVRITAALADLGGARRGRVRSLAVAGGKLLLHDRQQQIAPLGALVLLVLQQPLGAGEPARRTALLSAKEKTQAQPECATDGAQAFTGIQVGVMGAFERLADNPRPDRSDTPPSPAARDPRLPVGPPDRRARATGRHRPRRAARNARGPVRARRAWAHFGRSDRR